jgi:hypothetical protein
MSDSYEDDGRVVTQIVGGKALPGELRRHRFVATQLGDAYKQPNAPFGAFGVDTLAASTKAIAGNDATYAAIETKIAGLTSDRDALAADIRSGLDGGAFSGEKLSDKQARRWIAAAQALLAQAHALAAS